MSFSRKDNNHQSVQWRSEHGDVGHRRTRAANLNVRLKSPLFAVLCECVVTNWRGLNTWNLKLDVVAWQCLVPGQRETTRMGGELSWPIVREFLSPLTFPFIMISATVLRLPKVTSQGAVTAGWVARASEQI